MDTRKTYHTNLARAARANVALQAYRESYEPDEADARDLICDLLHLLSTDEERILADELHSAISNFNSECQADNGDQDKFAYRSFHFFRPPLPILVCGAAFRFWILVGADLRLP